MNSPSSRPKSILLAAAVAAVPLLTLATVASAQYQIDNGRANDANNRIGSGGYNSGGIPAPGTTVTGNDIVTGNVTGGKAFTGPVGYRGPNDFAAPTATRELDRFVQNSTGSQVSYSKSPNNFANNVLPFYSSVSTPPPDFSRTVGNYGFIPTADAHPHQLLSPRYDERLGVMTDVPPDRILPSPGQLLIPGPVDPSAGQTFISASPLTGIRQISSSDPATLAAVAGSLNYNGSAGLTDDQILRMRRELSATLATPDLDNTLDQQQQQQQQGGANVPGGRPQSLTQPLNGPGSTSFEAPENGSLSPKPLNTSLASAANNLSTGQGSENRMLASPAQQSSQYAEMRRRLDRYNAEQRPKTAEELNRDFQAQYRASQEKATTPTANQAKPQANAPGATIEVPKLGQRAQDIAAGRAPAGNEKAGGGGEKAYVQSPTGGVTAAVPSVPTAERAAPVDVRSLATGVQASGLRSLLQNAETSMQQGKFDTAIAQYQSAEQVAPNNPLILLGQANAELGGEYFARAENHLRQSFLLDPTLLMARYDLRAMLGDKRLDEVINGLKQIAAKETNQYSPAFLLAYIAYNSRDPERAASYLDLAEKRAAAPDPVFRLLRSHWNLPGTPAAAPSKPNK